MIRRASLLTLAIVIAISAPVLAFDEDFYGGNDILYYDDRAVACLAPLTSISSGSAQSSADEAKNAEIILRYLTAEKGLTLAQASGFVGNMRQESNLNPAIIQGGGTAPSTYTPVSGVGFGLVQWTFTERQAPLVSLARSTNRPITDIKLQLDYVWQEVTGAWKSTIQALTVNPSITPTDAAIIVHGRTNKVAGDPRFANAPRLGYEASADNADFVVKVRGGNAEYFYNMFKGKIPDGTGVTGLTSVDGARQASTGTPCASGTYVPTADCPVAAPIYGEGGNRHQLKGAELQQIYGAGGNAVRPNLVTLDFLGKPVQVHKLVAPCLQAVINDIEAKDLTYTVRTIGGWRSTAGQGSIAANNSYHYFGAALDINPDQNGYFEGTASHPYDMPQEYVDIFHAHGFSWGGNWTNIKDYMHFEFNGLKLPGA